ncbi:MAG TPA: response regulator, partial [Clostridia bacterium]|nr:response regulator [Clostridia bacterium]
MTSKILLVEDEAILAMAQAQKLQKNGFDVVLAHKGEQAVDMVATDRDVSLVLMDIDLGRGIDGTEAAQRILGDREIPIVFLTSHSEKEYVDKVKKITGYGYVLKNSGEFVLIESINMAYTLFAAKREALQHLHDSESAYQELEVREGRLQHVNRVLLSIRH